MTHAQVDVLVPAYNAEATIGSTLDSLIAQSLTNIRIVVVNDGSTDATAAIVRELARADARIHLVETTNQGIVKARNTALAQAGAEYVAWHDADDIALADRLSLQLDYLERNRDCVAVGGGSWFIDAEGRRTGYRVSNGGDAIGDPESLPAKEPWIGPFVMARTAALKQLGGYRDANYAEDTDLYWRLSEVGRLYNVPEAVAEYRLYSASVSSKAAANGRLSACNSQRAALSAIRRRQGAAELGFPASMQEEMRGAQSLAEMVSLASRDMMPAEAVRYEVAVAVQMLHLASYRPYRLSVQDSRFIGHHLMRNLRRFSLRELLVFIGWRLVYKNLRRGRFSQLLTTIDPANAFRSSTTGPTARANHANT